MGLATAIFVWNTDYMGEAVERLQRVKYKIHDDQISHIYPMLLNHLNLIGEYHFPGETHALTRLDALPLRSLDEALAQMPLELYAIAVLSILGSSHLFGLISMIQLNSIYRYNLPYLSILRSIQNYSRQANASKQGVYQQPVRIPQINSIARLT